MPLRISAGFPTLIIRQPAFERAQLTRQALDERLGLTAEEFQVERGLIVLGPVVADAQLPEVIADLEAAGLVYFDDFFELSGNWPSWLELFAQGAATRD
jgi:hypothetical protein